MAMSKAGNPAVSKLRVQITDTVAPVLAVAASPMDAIHGAGVWLGEMAQLRAENIALKNANVELLHWQLEAKELAVENEVMRKLMNMVPVGHTSFITARIVSDVGGPYVNSALISAGNEDNVTKDQAVVSEQGLLGRVVSVGERSARILLLSDINSRVPVMAEGSREKSILMGNNNDALTLSYLTADSKIKVGDRIVTSGDGGIFPSGIPVGVVTSIVKGVVTVHPFASISQASYVSVIDFDF